MTERTYPIFTERLCLRRFTASDAKPAFYNWMSDPEVTEFLTWDRPSDTITATGPEIHVNKRRRLSARGCAILQSFPSDYVFTGSLNRMYAQIGDAVPVLLARRVAETILGYPEWI